jgi:hypothetical protein
MAKKAKSKTKKKSTVKKPATKKARLKAGKTAAPKHALASDAPGQGLPEGGRCQCKSAKHGHRPDKCRRKATEPDHYCKPCHDLAAKEMNDTWTQNAGDLPLGLVRPR